MNFIQRKSAMISEKEHKSHVEKHPLSTLENL